MGELDDKVFDFCQKILKGDLEEGEIEKESASLAELMEKEGPKEAPDLFSIIPKEVIQRRIRRIGKFRGSEIRDCEFIGGGATGAFRLSLRSKKGRANLILKLADGKGDEFGSRLARAAGLACPQIYPSATDHEFMLIQDVRDLAGSRMGRETIDTIDLFTSAIDSTPFQQRMKTRNGRSEVFSAWLDYIERCRIGLIGDRQHANTAIAFGARGISFLPIDLDAVAYSILVKRSGEPYFAAYYNSSGLQSLFMVGELAKSGGKELFGEFRDSIVKRKEARNVMVDAEERIISEINDPRNIGIMYGIFREKELDFSGELAGCRGFGKRTLFTKSEAKLLSSLVERLCVEQERQKFLDAQLWALEYLKF